jgi:hypothetical protein
MPAASKCQAATASVANTLKQTAQRLTELTGQVETIDSRVNNYYDSIAVPAGQTLPDAAAMQAEITKAHEAATAEVAQLGILELRCTPNPVASINRLNQEVAQAVTAVKNYRSAVRTRLLAVRTRADQAQSTSSPTVAPTPEQLP